MTQQTSVAGIGDVDSSPGLRLTRTRLCSVFYYNYKEFVITIALLYYTVLIVINMTGNSNCFDVPCIPTRHLDFLAFSFV